MQTPSLRFRFIVAGVATVALLVLAVDAFVYLSLRELLRATTSEILSTRAQLARELAATLPPDELEDRLEALGVPAAIRPPGEELDPLRGPPGSIPLPEVGGPVAIREEPLPDGGSVVVFVDRGDARQTLRRVLAFEIAASLVGVGLAVLLLIRFSTVILGRLDHVVAMARRIAEGRTGERLRPDRPDTELGRLALAFDEMLEALEGALSEARVAEERSRRFLADAAHQLRTPVAGIRASIEALVHTPSDERRERLLDNLARESARLARLVTSLLRVAQLDRNVVPTLERVDLPTVLESEAARAADLAPSLRVEVRADELPPLPLDADSIAEALANLLDNARRHAQRTIIAELHRCPHEAVIYIRDDGPGVTAQDAEQIFERFVSLDTQGGSGLGLPIARAIVRLHGGELSYEDGSFVLRLPLRSTRDLRVSEQGASDAKAKGNTFPT